MFFQQRHISHKQHHSTIALPHTPQVYIRFCHPTTLHIHALLMSNRSLPLHLGRLLSRPYFFSMPPRFPITAPPAKTTQNLFTSGPLQLRWRGHGGGRSRRQAFLQPETPQHRRLPVFDRAGTTQYRRPAAAHEPGHVATPPQPIRPIERSGGDDRRRRRRSHSCPARKTGSYEEGERRR